MRITIHRGTDQIGGCVTEYEHEGWRLFVDYGDQLPGVATPSKLLEIEGLTKGDISHSALLITHYHGDHIGKIHELPEDLPIFMGKITRDIYEFAVDHKRFVDETSPLIVSRLQTVNTFSPGKKFSFGTFTIMPIVIDHSAFDAYAFRIEAGEVKVFHTGDFRTHGFRGAKLPKVIEKYVGRVDYLVCEATNISRPDSTNESESELKKRFLEEFKENKYNIVYLSSTNIDRLFALYYAAQKAGLPLYVDGYQRHMMDIVTQRDNIWGKSSNYKYEGYEPTTLMRDGDEFKFNERFNEFLKEKGYVLIARANPRFDNLIAKLPGEPKKRYLSMWNGYINPNSEAYNPALAISLKEGYVYRHTSGHCDMESLRNLVEMVSPRAIIPIHTNNPAEFANLFSDRWPVILLKDGESINPIPHNRSAANAEIIAVKNPSDNLKEVENPDNQKWWSIDDKFVGYFPDRSDALSVLKATIYAPNRVLGYFIETGNFDSDFVESYDWNFNLLATYSYGGHQPGEPKYQEPCRYKVGEKVLVATYKGINIVTPSIILGPVTEELMKTAIDNDPMCPMEYDEVKNQIGDFGWDLVAVHPLAIIEKSEFTKLNDPDLAQRIDIFPMREFEL